MTGASGALARLYDLDLSEAPGDLDLYLALAARAGGPVVELAVGTGRIALPLAAAGHEVTGVDLDPAMLDRAAARLRAAGRPVADRLTLVRGDLRDPAAEHRGRFSLAILALNSLLLFPDRREQANVVRVLASLLAPGGLAAVDVWQPQPVDLARMDGRVSLEWLRTDAETGEEVSKTASAWYDPSTRTVDLTTIFDAGVPGGAVTRWTRRDRMRLVGADELVDWAEAAGLEVERLAGDYDLTPFGAAAERAILVARRPVAAGSRRGA